MTVNWYELLDVAPDAPEAEIRSAWKAAVSDLDPTDRTFRVYNQAAEVLLDPQRRAAYDAELAAQQAEVEPEPVVLEKTESPVLAAPVPEPPAESTVAPPVVSGRRPTVPAWLLVGLALLTAVCVGVSSWLWVERPSDASVSDSTRAAQAAAERAIVPILSYDYAHLTESQSAADSYLTPDYRKSYDKLFEIIKQNAGASKTVVTAQVLASAVVRSGESRVEVLLFVDQPTTNKAQADPIVYKNQVRVQMEKIGSTWLVDCLLTTPNGSCD